MGHKTCNSAACSFLPIIMLTYFTTGTNFAKNKKSISNNFIYIISLQPKAAGKKPDLAVCNHDVYE